MSFFRWFTAHARFLVGGAFAVAAVGLRGADSKAAPPFVPEFEFPAPLITLAQAAEKNAIPLTGFAAPSGDSDALTPGDQVTALVSLIDGKKLSQWVIEARCVALDAEERNKPPLKTWTFYTNAGTEIVLGATRAAIAVRVLGPFERSSRGRENAGDAEDKRARVTVNADFLSLGLDRACDATIAVNEAKLKDPNLPGLNWAMRDKPFPAEETKKIRETARAMGLTPERERAVAGAIPALIEFFQIMSRTPGLDDILKRVIDVPWWKVISSRGNVHIGIMPQFRLAERLPADSPHLALKGQQGYTIPFQLSIAGDAALIGKLAVSHPGRPLLASAGIVGVAASAPDGKGPRVMLQLVSSQLGESSPAKSTSAASAP